VYKFLLVQYFDPTNYPFDSKAKPFYLNVDHISKIVCYDIDIHAATKVDLDGKRSHVVPEGAEDSILVHVDGEVIHLDVTSSRTVLIAIGKKFGKRGKVL
jgi:hypothetical protein